MSSKESIDAIIDFIRSSRNVHPSDAQLDRFREAVAERMSILNVKCDEDYRDLVQVQPDEMKELLDRALVRKDFVVNEPVWQSLRGFLSERFQNKERPILRSWIIGCDKGYEAYGLIMGFCELFGISSAITGLKFFATEIDEDRLAVARAAAFPAEAIEAKLPADMISRYFQQNDDCFHFKPELRKLVIFGRHNVFEDAPISRLDVIVCRNVISYYNAESQAKIASSLLSALNESGYLILGEGERLPPDFEIFRVGESLSIYQKTRRDWRRARGTKEFGIADGDDRLHLVEGAFDIAPVATICVDYAGILSAVNASARTLFGLIYHDVGRPLQDLEVSYRPLELRSVIELAYKERREVIINRVARHPQHTKGQVFDVHVRPLFAAGSNPAGVSIQFHDVTEMCCVFEDLMNLNQQLQTANEELQSAHEELEATNEELHSSNEELETTNEELQSTNEELETMNEELRSTNAELEFSNLGQREVAGTVESLNAFLESILASMPSAVMVVDSHDRILTWNERCEELWGLRFSEVRNEDFARLDIGLPVEPLIMPLHRVSRGKASSEEVVLNAINRRGKAMTCRARLTPLGNAGGCIIVIDEEV